MSFTFYDTPEVAEQPTVSEILASMSNQEKIAILNNFARLNYVGSNKRNLLIAAWYKLSVRNVKMVCDALDEVEEFARVAMRGEIVDTPASTDPETGEVTPATYVPPTTTVTALKNAVYAEFTGTFTQAECDAILAKMVAYSKRDGSGDWDFYKTEVVK